MKSYFVLPALALAVTFTQSAFAGKSLNICEKNRAAPQCAQATPKNPAQLPSKYSIDELIARAQEDFVSKTSEAAGPASCSVIDNQRVAFACGFTSSAGRKCQINLLQVWQNADFEIACEGGISIRRLVNPGPVPPTGD